MRTRVVTSALALSGLALLAGCGNGAVSSSASLDTLGKQLADLRRPQPSSSAHRRSAS